MRATLALVLLTCGQVAHAAPSAKPEATFPSSDEAPKTRAPEATTPNPPKSRPPVDSASPAESAPATAEKRSGDPATAPTPLVVEPPPDSDEPPPPYALTSPPEAASPSEASTDSYENSKAPLPPASEASPRSPIRFGVQALAGASTKSSDDVRLGVTGHVGVVMNPKLSVLAGLLANLPIQRDFRNTHFYGFEALVEWDPSELFLLSVGPALGVRTISASAPTNPGDTNSSTLAPGFVGRVGLAFGTRKQGQPKNALFVGVAAHAFFFEEFFFSPLLSVGYERY